MSESPPSTGSRRRRKLTVVAALAALVVVALGAWWLAAGRDTTGPPVGDGGQDVDPGAPGSELGDELGEAIGAPLGYEEDAGAADAAQELLRGLGSDADVAAATSPGTLEELGGGAAAADGALPDGARVDPRPTTWARLGNVATMEVEVAGPGVDVADVFLVWLVRDPDAEGWRITSTDLLAEGAT